MSVLDWGWLHLAVGRWELGQQIHWSVRTARHSTFDMSTRNGSTKHRIIATGIQTHAGDIAATV